MTVTQRSTPSGVLLPSSQRPRRSGPAPLLVLSLIGLALLTAGFGVFWLSERGTLPSRTTIGGVDVGGKSESDARRLVVRGSRRLVRRPMELHFDGDSVSVTGAQLRAVPRVDEAIAAADGTGIFERLVRRIGLGGKRTVTLRFDLDPGRLRLLGDELDGRVATEPRDAVLQVTAAGTAVQPSQDGCAVARSQLAARLRPLPASLQVPIGVVRPQVTTAAAERAQRVVDRLLSQPRIVALKTSKATLTPAVLRRALVLEPGQGGLAVRLDPDVLRKRLGPRFRELEQPARDAGFRIVGTRAIVVPAQRGRELDLERIGRSLVSNLRSTVHRARFLSPAPALSTKEAETLGITELVSEFTTYYPCCAPRVTNIQRAAELLDGTILRSGESFSLNGALGKRTVENGFVLAPQIFAGRLEDAVGGGISQVATTMFNAAFFAGLRLDEHQAHQFYISRYPMGREATVSWGGPELVFTNDWKAGLLIKVSASDSAISIRVYSSKLGRRVETVTEKPYAYRQPTTRTTKNPALPPGKKRVLQEAGGPGFTVQYTRQVYRGSTLIRDERFTTRYDPQNGYVEIGPKKKKKKKPGPPPPGDATADVVPEKATPPAEPPPVTD